MLRPDGMLRTLAALVMAVLLVALAAAPARAQSKPPLVFAAASLQESLTAAAIAWEKRGHPRPVLSFAASSALARQIEAGAPADLFLSADEEWMDHVERLRLVKTGTRVGLLGNRLVLIAPAASRLRLAVRPGFPLARALGDGRLALADPAAVPAGRYARAALTSLGVWDSVAGKLAPAENVRAALAFVERGEAPLGIVYETDARASVKVRVVGRFPAATHPPIVYPVALLRRSRNPEAEAFRRFLVAPAGRSVFRRFGFGTR
ncbi:MAG: molybdate ABC transporter substrate-binding protein [Novosphingobium sp.]